MKRMLIWMGTALICGTSAMAQETTTATVTEDRKGYIGLMLGPSFPVGDYASTDINSNEEAGLAKSGFSMFIVDFGYNFHKNFGLAASWFGGTNPLDAQKLADYYAANLGGAWTISSGSYGYGGLFLGPLFTLPLNKLELDLRLTGGFASGIFPEIKYAGSNNGTSVSFKQESANGTGFGYAIGAGARFHISKKFNLMTRVEYIGMEPEAEIVLKQRNSSGSYTEVDRMKVKQPMNTVNVLIGFAYRLK